MAETSSPEPLKGPRGDAEPAAAGPPEDESGEDSIQHKTKPEAVKRGRASVISTRVGAALALVLSIVAVALAVVAFMATVRDDGVTRGRLVQSGMTNDSNGGPVLFPVDDFFLGLGSDARLHAFYVYPPGYFGHTRGCKVVWDPAASVDTPKGKRGPGLFVDPCGGARFDIDGELVSGPADRGLDYFATIAGVEGAFVDTRKLICGKEVPVVATPESADDTPTATPGPREKTCERVSPDTAKP